jgi:hypothetical protein
MGDPTKLVCPIKIINPMRQAILFASCVKLPDNAHLLSFLHEGYALSDCFKGYF